MNLYSTVGDCKIRRTHTSTSLSVTGEDTCRVYNLQLKISVSILQIRRWTSMDIISNLRGFVTSKG